MDEGTPSGEVAVVEQRHHGGAEEPVAEEVGGQIEEDGGMGVAQSDGTEEMHRIVGRQDEQGGAHEPSRTEIVYIYLLLWRTGKEHVKTEKQHQGQGNAERIVVQ